MSQFFFNYLALRLVKKMSSFYVYTYFFCIVVLVEFFCTELWFQVFLLNTNNLPSVIWFQV